MEPVKNDFYMNVKIIAEQCIQSGVDPVTVLLKALEEKTRMDSLVQDALEEDDVSFDLRDGAMSSNNSLPRIEMKL